MDCLWLCFDILDDLSDELAVNDHFRFILVNDLTSELSYKVVRSVEFYYRKFGSTIPWYRPFHDCDWGDCERMKTIGEVVSYKGDVEVLKWLFTNSRIGSDDKCIYFACCGNHLDAMKWLYTNHKDDLKNDFYRTTKHACYNGNLDIIKWLFGIRDNYNRIIAMSYACEYGQIEIIEWLHKYQDRYLPDPIDDDGYSRMHLNTVKWMIENDKCSTKKALRWAHVNKSVEIIEILCRHRIDEIAKFMFGLNNDVFKCHPPTEEIRSDDDYQ